MRPSARTSSVVPQRFGRCHLLPALTSLVRLQFREIRDMGGGWFGEGVSDGEGFNRKKKKKG